MFDLLLLNLTQVFVSVLQSSDCTPGSLEVSFKHLQVAFSVNL